MKKQRLKRFVAWLLMLVMMLSICQTGLAAAISDSSLPAGEAALSQVTFSLQPEDAVLTVTDETGQVQTAQPDGYWLADGAYHYTAALAGYETETEDFSVKGEPQTISVQLTETAASDEATLPLQPGDAVLTEEENDQKVENSETESNEEENNNEDALLTANALLDVEPIASWSDAADTAWYDEAKTDLEIKNAQELAGLAAIVNGTAADIAKDDFAGKTITLTADIDLESKEWTPIGVYNQNKFAGTLDGNGKTITNLKLKSNMEHQALIAHNTGKVKNLIIKSDSLVDAATTNTRYSSAFVARNEGVVVNCVSDVIINAANAQTIGGIVGYNSTIGYIVNCANLNDITAKREAGGIVGNNYRGMIIGCYNRGDITSTGTTGGIVGTNSGTAFVGTVKNCYSTGAIASTQEHKGGIVGYASQGVCDNNYYLSTETVNQGLNGIGVKYNAASAQDPVAKDEDGMKGLAESLGGIFVADAEGPAAINDGYPVFDYQKTGVYAEESDGLEIVSIEAENGLITATLNKSLIYTQLSPSDFTITIDNSPVEITDVSVDGNAAELEYDPVAPEAVEQNYAFSVQLRENEAKTGNLTVKAFILNDFAVENGKFTATVDSSFKTSMIALDDFKATISKDGGEAEPLELKRVTALRGKLTVTFETIANSDKNAIYTVTLQYKDGEVYTGSFSLASLYLDSIDSFNNPSQTFGMQFMGKDVNRSTKGILTVNFNEVPEVDPKLSDFAASYVSEIDGEFEITNLNITAVKMDEKQAQLSFDPIPLTKENQDITIRVSYKGGARVNLAQTLPASRNWSAYAKKPAVGNGSEESPYQIGTAEELAWFAALTNGDLTDGTAQNLKACAELTANIELNDTSDWESWDKDTQGLRVWKPIAYVDTYTNATNGYQGTFDGKGYTISGMYTPFDLTIAYTGPGFVSHLCGTVKNLKIEKSYLYSTREAGGITATGRNCTIQNCGTSMVIEQDGIANASYLGGIAGCLKYSDKANCVVSDCYSIAELKAVSSAKGYVGGIVGCLEPVNQNQKYTGGAIANSYFLGTVTSAGNNSVVNGIVSNKAVLFNNKTDENGDLVYEDGALARLYGCYTSISNCYSAGTLSASNGTVNGISNLPELPANSSTYHYYFDKDLSEYFSNNYYLGDGGASNEVATEKTEAELKAVNMGDAYTILSGVNDGYPALKWQGEEAGDLSVVAAPVFTLSGGGLQNSITLEISTATEGATIIYTTDGSDPSIRHGEEYTKPIPLEGTVKAIAYKDGMYLSAMNAISASTVPDPVISPSSPYGQTLNEKTKVSITCGVEGATIYYTTDGSDPVIYGEKRNTLNTSTRKYTGKITVEEPTTIKAVAVADGMLISQTVTASYDFSWNSMTSTPEQDENGVYQIANARELAWFAALVSGNLSGVAQNASANARLTADIDMGAYVWTPIGSSTPFKGVIDGDGHSIQNLYFGNDNHDGTGGKSDPKGFVFNNAGTIKNLTFTGKDVDLGLGNVGMVAVTNSGTISNCHNEVNICTFGRPVAGIAGTNSGVIEFCSNSGTIAGTKEAYNNTSGQSDHVAGIAGNNNSGGVIRDCYNVGAIAVAPGLGIAGQIAAEAKDGSSIERCYALGSIANHGRRDTGTSDWSGWSGVNPYNGNDVGVNAGLLAGGVASAEDTSGAKVTDSYFMQDITLKGDDLEAVALNNDNFKAIYYHRIQETSYGTNHLYGFAGRRINAEAAGLLTEGAEYYVFYDVTNDKYLALELSEEPGGEDVVIDATDETVPHFSGQAGNYMTTYNGEYYLYKIPADTKVVQFINTEELQDYSTEDDLTDFRATAIESENEAAVLAQVKETWPDKYDEIAAAIAYANPPSKQEEKPIEGNVRVIIENTTFTEASQSADGKTPPPWSGTLVDTEVELTEDMTMMSAILAAAAEGGVHGETVTITGAEQGYISGINGLAEFHGKGKQSGWMGTLNDWFTNAGFAAITAKSGYLRDGCVIRVMYTNADNGGTDLGGSIEGDTNTRLKELSFTNGTLTPAFDGVTTEYTLNLNEGATDTTISYVAANKAFQARTYINDFKPGEWGYKSGDTLTVSNGDKIIVGVGNTNWASMQQGARETRYTITVGQSTEPPITTEYTVTFDSQGGSEVAEQKVIHGEKATKPQDPVRENYNFAGWYREADCKTSWNFEQDTVGSDITLYAKWMEQLPYEKSLEGVLSYIQTAVTNPKVGSTNGEWAVISLARGNVDNQTWYGKYLENLESYVAEKQGVLAPNIYKYTEYSRISLAITALGKDASAFIASDGKTYDLVKPLTQKGEDGKYYPMHQGNNSIAFALIALDSANYYPQDKETRAAYIDALKENQLSDGLWSISSDSPNIDTSAMVLQALAPYYKDEAKFNSLGATTTYAELKTMVDKAVAALKAKAGSLGGYDSVEAADQVLVALCSLGIDPQADGWELLDEILKYRDPSTGGFKHEANGEVNQMATEQSAYSLVAYDRFVKNQNTLYDMTDINIAKPTVEEVIAQINALPAAAEVELTDRDAIEAARAAYDALSAEEKEQVPSETLKKLTDAEEALLALKPVTGVVLTPAAKELKVGDTLQLTATVSPDDAAVKEVTYKSDKESVATVSDTGLVTAVSKGTANITVTTKDGNKTATATITVVGNSSSGGSTGSSTIRVSFTLLGDKVHGEPDESTGTHTLRDENLETWIAAKTYEVAKNSNVLDVFEKALKEHDMTWDNSDGNYIASITRDGITLGEFTNGDLSGWMYTLNGKHPLLGVAEQTVKDGDKIVFHYTDDYTKEEGSENWNSGGGEAGSTESKDGILFVGAGGKVTPVDLSDYIGKDVTIQIKPDAGYQVKDVVIDGKSVGAVTSYTYENLKKTSRIQVTFEKIAETTHSFADINSNHWAAKAVDYVYGKGLMTGVSATEFEPNSALSRAMLVTVLYRMAGEPETFGENLFSDVMANTWYTEAVLWANGQGIVSGYGDGNFGPDDAITREQLAAIFYRYAGSPDTTGAELDVFTDAAAISDYARSAMLWSVQQGIITGKSDGMIDPKGNASRAEAATIIYRYLEKVE